MKSHFKGTITIVAVVLILNTITNSTVKRSLNNLSDFIKNKKENTAKMISDQNNYIPLKSIAEALGQELIWDEETNNFCVENVEEEKTIEVQKVFCAGKYKVGVDIPPGEYKLFSDSIMAYYELCNNETGSISSMISNDMFNNHTYLTIEEGNFLTLQGSYAIEISNLEETKNKELYKAGMYKVGFDIPSGEYTIYKEENQKFGYLEIFSDSKGSFESVISSFIFEDNKTVELEENQYIKIQSSYFKEEK